MFFFAKARGGERARVRDAVKAVFYGRGEEGGRGNLGFEPEPKSPSPKGTLRLKQSIFHHPPVPAPVLSVQLTYSRFLGTCPYRAEVFQSTLL